ncbi:MAG: 1-deoxy-D-xylulose-5-phosphate synthase [Clostridia bacterium]|nr:1-deoxy-D-xylulose-5-phosphate synthase [Clostridia bacterium]
MSILRNVNSPKDIKLLDIPQLEQLAAEIRELILSVVLEKGGHLSSNLGVVELIIALHYVFDFDSDRLILDVGHQCYAHKILTGRKDDFLTLRTKDGISGFPKSEESVYDAANTGHSSTSISLACGLLRADIGDEKEIVTLIGDGAMTGGLVYEALNDASTLHKKFIAIINNNDMSISVNVGGIAEYLRDLDSIRKPFSEYGISYFGSVDGHNLSDLISMFARAKSAEKSIIINVHTIKGKGYAEAEAHPDKYHSYNPSARQGKTFSSVMGNKLAALAKADKDIFAITAAMADGTGLDAVKAAAPGQFADVGIAEQHALCMASGMAMGGKKPYFAVYSSFLQRAYDQVIHDMCLNDCDVTLCIDRAGFVSGDGETHQGLYDISFLRSIPNMTVFAPKDYRELEDALDFSVEYTHPLAIRYPKYDLTRQYDTHAPVKLGKWEVVRDCGGEVVILACGALMNDIAMKLAKALGNIDVINARFVKPLDTDMLRAIADRKIMTMEDNVLAGGFGSAVLEYYNFVDLHPRIKIKAVDDITMTHASLGELLEMSGFGLEQLTSEIKQLIDEIR